MIMTGPEVLSLAKDAALLIVTPALSVAFTFVAFKSRMEAKAEAVDGKIDRVSSDLDKFKENFHIFTSQAPCSKHAAILGTISDSLHTIIDKLDKLDFRINKEAMNIAILEERIKKDEHHA